MKKTVSVAIVLTLVGLLLTLAPAHTFAQADFECSAEVTVQSDDWLSNIADKFYGNLQAFPAIVEATNAKAVIDARFTAIEDANVIEPGWVLCVAATDTAQTFLGSDVTIESEVAQYGGTVVLTTGDDFAGPAGNFDGGSTHDTRLFHLLYDSLLIGRQDGRLEPRLARSITLADDGLTWTVSLRDDAIWHDGQPITADDFIWNVNTICAGKTDPPAPATQYQTIEGCGPLAEGEVDTVTGLTRIDDHTIQVVTTKPDAALLYIMASMNMVPAHIWQGVPPENLIQEPGWLDQPVGSGPFKMVNYIGDQQIDFEAFEGHYLGRPFLDKIIVRIAPYDSALAGLEAGEVDLVTYMEFLDVERLQETRPDITIGSTAESRTWGLFFHYYQEELRDPRIQRALQLAVNRDAYNDAVLGGLGNTNVKSWYTPGTWPANPDIPADPFDPEGARALFEEANWDFENTTMGIAILPANKPRARIGEFVQASLADIGVKSVVMPVQESVVTTEWWNQREDIWFTIAYIGGTTATNPYAWYNLLRYEDNELNWGSYGCRFVDAETRGGLTPAEACGHQYGSPELDALMDQALAIADPEKAAPIMWEIDQILHDDPPGVMFVGPVTIHAWSDNLRGRPSGELYDMQFWIKPEQWWLAQ